MTKFWNIVLLPILFFALGCKSKSPTEIICGGSMNFACPADMYCNSKENCGGIDQNGICVIRPTQCKAENQPVCGCDGQTYSSPCLAAAKGVSLKLPGTCVVAEPVADEPVADESGEEMQDEQIQDEGISGK